MPKFRSNSIGKGGNAWTIRSVNCRFILASQQWATILLTFLFAVIPLMIIYWSPSITPRHRPVYIYDATISYPMAAHDTVPTWAAYTVPYILLIISVLVGELVICRSMHNNLTNALAAALHFIVDAVAAFFVAILVQRATKTAVGRLRPDFLDRCKPAALLGNSYLFHLEIGSYIDPGCTETDQALLDDGRSSFPSGHTNMSAVLCAYVAGYCLWTVYMRHGHPTSGAKEEQRGWMHFMRRDLCQALALYWILLMLGISWAIAGSRIVDNKHHPSDVVAGFVLGASVAVIFLLRSIPCARFMPRYDGHVAEAQPLRGGEGSGGADVDRDTRRSEGLAELGQHSSNHTNGYHAEGNRGSGAQQEMAMRGGHYPSQPKGYPAFTPGSVVHPQPAPKYAGAAAPFGVQHSIPLS
ncbi:g12810 [Coccomyxa viridis]|uniref:G12810 protein n=1 Tax=Coccomyxa viridis TaxID=1274662 RepID=A0ABP1GDX0_9CHLO